MKPVLLIVGQLILMLVAIINIVVATNYDSRTSDIIEYDVVRRLLSHIVGCVSSNEWWPYHVRVLACVRL
jgi:hypothetical protein